MSPTYTPKSRAEESRVIEWLTKSRINWTSRRTSEGITYEIGCVMDIPGTTSTKLVHYQNTRYAFELLRLVSEAGSVSEPLLSKITQLLKAVNAEPQ